MRKLSDHGSDIGPLGAAFIATGAWADTTVVDADPDVTSSLLGASPLLRTTLASSPASRLHSKNVLKQSNENKFR